MPLLQTISDIQYNKVDENQMEVVKPKPETTSQIISYQKILDDIAECEAKLVDLNILKVEAEKLNLTT